MADFLNRVLWPVFTVLCAYSLYRSWRLGRRRTVLVSWGLAFAGGVCSSLAGYGILPIAGFVGKVMLIAFALVYGFLLRPGEERRLRPGEERRSKG